MMAGPLRIKAQPVHAQVECDNVIGGRGKGKVVVVVVVTAAAVEE